MVRNIGIMVSLPKKACENGLCPFHGTLSIRGRLFSGIVESNKANKMIVVSREYNRLVTKYKRYERCRSKVHAFLPDCISVKEGEKVSFESRIGGGFTPYSYEWDFGDGETSTAVNPTHAYKTAGYYNVTLKVTDDRGNHGSRIRESYIEVLSGWNPGNVVRSAWNGLIVFGQVLVNILIWVVILCPIWIIGGGIFLWIRH